MDRDSIVFDPPPLGCVLYYPGLGGGSTIYDRSLYGLNGTITGAVWTFQNGLWYLDFDGTDDKINTNTTFESTFQDSFYIDFWIKPDDGRPGTADMLCGNRKLSAEDFTVILIDTDGTLTFQYLSNAGTTATAKTSAAVFADGQETWHKVTMVADSTVSGDYGVKGFLDGVEITYDAGNKGNTSLVTFADFAIADNFYFGAQNRNGATQNPFAGGQILQKIGIGGPIALEILNQFNQEKHLFGVW